MKFWTIYISCIFILPCKQNTKETILGLRLGAPCDYAIQKLKQDKIIIHDKFNSDYYYDFWIAIRAYVRTLTYPNSEGKEILGTVWIALGNSDCSSNYEKANYPMGYVLRKTQAEAVLNLYKEKYGNPINGSKNKVEGFSSDKYLWQRGDMEIIMSINKPSEKNFICPENNYTVNITYKYIDEIMKKLKKNKIKGNKNL